MWKDPIVEEVRKVREQIFAECDYDLDKYIAYIKAAEAKGRAEGRVYVSMKDLVPRKDPRVPKPKTASM